MIDFCLTLRKNVTVLLTRSHTSCSGALCLRPQAHSEGALIIRLEHDSQRGFTAQWCNGGSCGAQSAVCSLHCVLCTVHCAVSADCSPQTESNICPPGWHSNGRPAPQIQSAAGKWAQLGTEPSKLKSIRMGIISTVSASFVQNSSTAAARRPSSFVCLWPVLFLFPAMMQCFRAKC